MNRERENAARDVIRYSKSARGARNIEREGVRTGRGFFGTLVDMVADILSGGRGRPNRQEVREAERQLQRAGIPPGEPIPPPIQDRERSRRPRMPGAPEPPQQPRTEPKTETQKPKTGPKSKPAADEIWPDEHDIDTRTVISPEERTGVDDSLTDEIEAPESSNVFSIQYDKHRGVLYVTFKADSKQKPRPHVRGARYAYGGAGRPVPPVVWDRLRRGASKGKAVWDHLRIRGTVWGHQYPYRLVDSATDYVPRKATRRGFKVRRIPAIGRGKRSTRKSTLPPRSF